MEQWNISQAKARFTQLIRSSESAPQIVCNRGKPISAMVDIELFNELMALKEKDRTPTIPELLEELKSVRQTEQVDIEVPQRCDRPNPLEDEIDEMAL